ncbi:exodeoxyribonuclease VII large subunit [Coraliomargarita sinensis]|uniref:Exodeoxyribonuclease 7 large subunit n=1 Tax=Coraliomargarita sinensis TaxID=2174842 RepID=A0A317ZJS8_9BACT|nr:exodeoxyribonuclease VII large subunit [Coraliomargarita sinensis]PXA03611.1 exodeoxyribonuclease VII large subunit [Coraliomargarita sinensis]
MMDDLLMPAADEVLDVTALTRLIKGQLEGRFARIWVRGEVSNLRRQSSGHVYFSLKDAGSQLPCAFFARDVARQSFDLEDGMEVMLLGDISVYVPHGRYQLIAKIAIQSGEGRLQLEFERLKRKLASEGLFDAARKQQLPLLPRKIAVITSPTGAAVRDFLRILKRREFHGEVMVFPAKVQGKGAADEVAAMLAHANASPGFDLVVLTRGGGSIEDLWAFNEEALARAVGDSRLPVISAIGHEIDHVLTDYAADRRAETPSGAAELISSLYLEACARVDEAGVQLQTQCENQLRQLDQQIEQLRARLRVIAPSRQVELLGMRIDDIENRLLRGAETRLSKSRKVVEALSHRMLQQHPKLRLQLGHQKVLTNASRLKRAAQQNLQDHRGSLVYLAKRLENSSLKATLDRGYAILQAEDGRIIPDKKTAESEKSLRARLRDGEIKLRVDL